MVISVNNTCEAAVFSIVPKSGVNFPQLIPVGGQATAYYTVTNTTGSFRAGNYVKYLPPNTTQVTSDNNVPDLCGATFSLAANASCTLELNINGPIDSNVSNPKQHLIVCLGNCVTCCAGTQFPLNVREAKLKFEVQPSHATPYATTTGVITPSVVVSVLDNNNQLITNTSIPIRLSISHQPNTGIYTGLLFGTRTVNSQSGIAAFNDLSITQIGTGYTLAAASEYATSTVSSPFNITQSTAGYTKTSEKDGSFEILDLSGLGPSFQGIVPAYLDYGTNPINAEEFENFSEPGYVKNSPRQPVFDYGNTFGSPNAPAGPLITSEIGGYTWGLIAEVQNFDWPFDPSNYPAPPPSSGWQAGYTSPTVPENVVKYTIDNKNQPYIFTTVDDSGNPILRFFITDEWGNVYLMKSANAANDTPEKLLAAFNAAVLPAGWTKSTGYLTQYLYGVPAKGGENNLFSSYQEFRDSGDNSYFQIFWSETGNSIAQQIGYPMPIWAGPADTRVNGTTGNDLLS